jgi:hypothetical protein
VIVALQLPQPTGVVGPLGMALPVWIGLSRLRLAMWVNNRNRLTT